MRRLWPRIATIAIGMIGLVLLVGCTGEVQRTPTAAGVPTPVASVTNPDDADMPAGKLKLGDTSMGGPNGAAQDAQAQLEMFLEAWTVVEQQFYDQSALNRQKMARGAIRGMLEALGDEGTAFSDPPTTNIARQDLSGSFEGIGVTVEVRNQQLTIVAPFDGSPGAKAGLRAGDVITAIDDRDATKLSLAEAVSLIRGPRGTTVRLTVTRERESSPVTMAIAREAINVASVTSKMLEGSIGYVRINQFAQPTPGMLKQQLGEMMAKRPKALILDLRNNPGGLLSAAVQAASEFLADGVVLYAEQRDSPQVEVKAAGGGVATSVPVVVLVNKGTSSAAEVVAAALRDRGRGVLVGEATFGKDSVQNVHQLPDGSTISITTARWLTPKKQQIGGQGLAPDIVVATTADDIKAGRDPQLERALQRALTGA